MARANTSPPQAMANRSFVLFRFCLLKPATRSPNKGSNSAAYNVLVPLPPGGRAKASWWFRNVWIVISTLPEPGVAGDGLNWQFVPAGWPLQLKVTGPSGSKAFMVMANVAVSPWNTVTLFCTGVSVSTGPGGMISKVADVVLPVPPLVEDTAPLTFA